MKFRIAKTISDDQWDRFVVEHPCSNVYHTKEMYQVFGCTNGFEPTLWVALNELDRPLTMLIPVHINLIPGPLARYLSRIVVFGGVLCAPQPEKNEVLKVLLNTFGAQTGKSAMFTEFRNASNMKDLNPTFAQCGYVFNEHLNIFKDLTQTRDKLWKGLRSTARTNVRKAHRDGVEIQEIHDRNGIKDAYSIIRATYRRVHVPIPNYSLLESAFKILQPKEMILGLLAHVDSKAIGTMILLLFKEMIICWYTGSLRRFSSYRASDLLFWHTMEWGQENGFHTLDLGGAGRPDRQYGVRRFKSKFGDEIVNHGRYIRIHTPRLYKLFNTGYQFARGLKLTRADLFLPDPVD